MRSAPHVSHVSRWPPRAAVRHVSIACIARRCARDSACVWRYAAPWVRKMWATSTAGLRLARGTPLGAHAAGIDYARPSGLGRSRGERVPTSRPWLRWKYRIVVEIWRWPSSRCTVCRSTPASSRWVAKAWRRAWNAALLVDAGPEFRHRVDLLGDRDVDRAGALAIGEEPDAWGRALPVRAEVLKEPRGERHVAVLGALALRDPHGHAVGVNVPHLERDRLADAQACGIDGGEQKPMARMRRHRQQPPHLFPAQNLRQFLRLLREGHVKIGPRMAERHVIEESEGVGRLTARAPGQLPLVDQVGEIGLHLIAGDLVRRSPVVLCQSHDGGDVRRVGAPGEPTHGHVANHAVSE